MLQTIFHSARPLHDESLLAHLQQVWTDQPLLTGSSEFKIHLNALQKGKASDGNINSWQATFDPAVVAANTARNAGQPRPPGFPYVAGADPLNAESDEATMAQAPDSPPPHSPMRRRTSSTGTNSRSASFSLPGQKSGHQMTGHVSPGGEVAEDEDDEPLDPEGRYLLESELFLTGY